MHDYRKLIGGNTMFFVASGSRRVAACTQSR